jgi:hypothetical protein
VLGVLASDASPLFEDVTSTDLPTLTDFSMDAHSGDVDGDLDIVIANEFRPNLLLINDGSGHFIDESSTRIPQVNRDSEDVGIADFDGDGRVDFVVVTEVDRVNELYLNAGNGSFADAGNRLPVTSRSNAVLVADLGGDAIPDILIGNNGQNVLLINDGHGFFTDETGTRLPSIVDVTQDVEVGLINDDEHLDVLVGNEGANRILNNNGQGVFTDESLDRLPLRVTLEETREADLGDVDCDGDLDIFFANVRLFVGGADRQNRLLINDGSGFFADETAARLPTDADDTFDGDFVDIDDDGYLDIVTANFDDLAGVRAGAPYRVYLNDGDGVFMDETDSVFPSGVVGNGLDIESFDADGDGRKDLFLSSRGGADRLLISVQRDFFIRGDANTDGLVDLSDALAALCHLFLGAPAKCLDAVDTGDEGVLDVGDPLLTLRYLFLGVAPPNAPGPRQCGPDPTEDVLDCQEFTACDASLDF